MREIDVTGLQCTQAVMAVLREIVSMEKSEEMHISYEAVSYTHLRAHET